MKRFKSIFVLFAALVALSSCKKDSSDDHTPGPSGPTQNLVLLGETYIIGAEARAMVYAERALQTGYNALYVALFDSTDGSALTSGHFELTPIMTMGPMEHACPVENSELAYPVNGYYKSFVVFSMPGSAMEWTLNMNFHNHKNDLEGEGSLGVGVAASDPPRFLSTVIPADENAKVFISFISPKSPQVGLNEFEVVLHKMTSMMDFPAIEDYTIVIEPEMPSMGHGSPNNIDPTHMGKGHYKGQVNFTMTGLWYVHLKLYKGGILISSDQFFEITL